MSSQPSTTTSATLAPGQLAGSPLPSGSLSALQTPGDYTGRATQSLPIPSAPNKLDALLAAVPMWNGAVETSLKPSNTAAKRRLEYPDLGALASPQKGKASGQTSTNSRRRLLEESQDVNSFSSSPHSSSSSQEASNTLGTLSSNHRRGVTSGASTSTGRQAQASRPSSTQLMDTATFTLSQARGILGSTSTMASKFSSLTSIRTALNARRSLGGWTDILSKCKSKEVTSLLAGLTSTSSQTRTGTSGGTRPSNVGSRRVVSSNSRVNAAPTTTWSGTSKENEIDLCASSDEEDDDYSEHSSDEDMINDEDTESDYEETEGDYEEEECPYDCRCDRCCDL